MSNSTHILVVDDDERICNLLVRYMQRQGYKMSAVRSGEELRRFLGNETPDIIILDLMLPDADGLDLAREIRNQTNIAIIMVTARGETVEKIVGLETGADDYIVKPFDNRELLARVRSISRRLKAGPEKPQTYLHKGDIAEFAGWTFDLTAYELVSPEGKIIPLTSYEYKLLSALVLSGNRVMKRDYLLNLVAEREWNPDNRSVDVLIGKLRKKLEKNPGEPAIIKTIRGTGYKFTAQVTFSKEKQG